MKSDIRHLIDFVKLSAAGPSAPASMGGGNSGIVGGPNPIQKIVAEQQAAAQGQATPQGNPEVLKMQDAALQAQQQGQQAAMAAQQQAQQQVMQAQQQVAQAEAKAQQQASGQIQKLQAERDKAVAEKLKAEGEAEIAKIDSKKTEILARENPPVTPEAPPAPPANYGPLLKRLGGRVGKAVTRLTSVAPALKMAQDIGRMPPVSSPVLPVDPLAPPVEPAWASGPLSTQMGAGQRLQNSGYYNNDAILTPRNYVPAWAGSGVGGEVTKFLRKYLWREPNYAAHYGTDVFSIGGGHAPTYTDDQGLPQMIQPQMFQPDYMQLGQQMLQNGAQGFLNNSGI
jgi:hypothetical protein